MHERRVPSKDGLSAEPSWGLDQKGWKSVQEICRSEFSVIQRMDVKVSVPFISTNLHKQTQTTLKIQDSKSNLNPEIKF